MLVIIYTTSIHEMRLDTLTRIRHLIMNLAPMTAKKTHDILLRTVLKLVYYSRAN